MNQACLVSGANLFCLNLANMVDRYDYVTRTQWRVHCRRKLYVSWR
jgi:hypothetical protein